MLQEIAISILY